MVFSRSFHPLRRCVLRRLKSAATGAGTIFIWSTSSILAIRSSIRTRSGAAAAGMGSVFSDAIPDGADFKSSLSNWDRN
jgi:hypothetical protein